MRIVRRFASVVVVAICVGGLANASACSAPAGSASDDGASEASREAGPPVVVGSSGGGGDGSVSDANDGADAMDSAEPCIARDTDAPPASASFPKKLAGQDAWIHDEKSPAGYFHTFDALVVGTGAQAAPRKVHVFLPRSYTKGCARYPVVYMNDGNTAFFPGGVGNKTWDVAAVLAKGYADKAIPEVIVVAVHPIERDREYTHAPWLTGRSCCEVASYTSYLASAVKPFVDGAYRTKPGASDTVIVGSSHGGLAAFYAASTRPEIFGRAIAMSSSFWAGLDEVTIGGPLSTSALMTAASPGLAKRPRLYLDWGLVRTGGTHNSIIEDRATARGTEMSALLASSYGYVKESDLFTVEDPLGEHEEISWGRRLGPALAKIFAK